MQTAPLGECERVAQTSHCAAIEIPDEVKWIFKSVREETYIAIVVCPYYRDADFADYLKKIRPGAWVYRPHREEKTLEPVPGRNGRRVLSQCALLPGFVFVKTRDLETHFKISKSGYLLREDGIAPVLKGLDYVRILQRAKLSFKAMNKIMRMHGEFNQLLPAPVAQPRDFKVGQWVKFAAKAFDGLWPPSKIARIDRNGTVHLQAHLMGQIVPIKARQDQLVAV